MGLSSQQLADAGRQLEVPFDVELLHPDGSSKLAHCVELLRLVPGRRVVVKMLMDEKVFLGKIFIGSDAKKYCSRERAGIEALERAGVQSAGLVAHLELIAGAGEVLLLEYLPNVKHLSVFINEQSEKGDQLLDMAIRMMADLHSAGLQHKDCHLGNFLVTEQGLYLVDGDAVETCDELSPSQALQNLALFIVQLPLNQLPRLSEFWGRYSKTRNLQEDVSCNQLQAQVDVQRADRQRRFLKKIYRDCTQFKVDQSKEHFVVLDRQEESAELADIIRQPDKAIANGVLLKDGNSATVAKVTKGDKIFVVKRYNIKNFRHWLSRCWRPSRAWVSWRNAQLLAFYGIGTPKPLAMIEQRSLGLRGKAYFIAEFNDASDAITYVEQAEGDEVRLTWLARQFSELFDVMRLLKISHGDLKGTNFLIENDGLSVIDLDSMCLHNSEKELEQALGKDVRRFMKNWAGRSDIESIMSTATKALSN